MYFNIHALGRYFLQWCLNEARYKINLEVYVWCNITFSNNAWIKVLNYWPENLKIMRYSPFLFEKGEYKTEDCYTYVGFHILCYLKLTKNIRHRHALTKPPIIWVFYIQSFRWNLPATGYPTNVAYSEPTAHIMIHGKAEMIG